MSTPAELLRALGREAREGVSNGAPSDQSIRTYRGRSVEDIIPKIQRELGADAIIVRRRDGLAGGVLGFFQHPYVEIEAMRGAEGIDVYDDDEPVGPSYDPPASYHPPAPPAPPGSAPRGTPVTPPSSAPTGTPAAPPGSALGGTQPAAAPTSAYVSAQLAALARAAPAEGGFRTRGSAPAVPPAGVEPPPATPMPSPPPPAQHPEALPAVAEPPVTEPAVDFHELIMRGEAEPEPVSQPEPAPPEPEPYAYEDEPYIYEDEPFVEYVPAYYASEGVPRLPPRAPARTPRGTRSGAHAGERRAVALGSHSRARGGVEKGLRHVGVSAELADELVDGATAHTLALVPRSGLAQAVRTTIARRIPVAPPLPTRGAAIVVVGAGGTGKTTCCAALLAAYRGASTLPASFATLTRGAKRDDLRLILAPGIVKPTAAGTPRALSAMRRAKREGLVVVDTPRLSPADKAGIRALALLLGELAPERIVVALPATLGAEAASQLLVALRPLGANALAVTHVDETDQIGVAVEAACAFGLAPEYLLDCAPSGGWRLRRVDPHDLASRLLP